MLRKGDEYSTLAESLTTLGVVLSRGGNIDEAVRTFTDAKEIALNVGDMESAGNAVLTQLEELQPNLTSIVIRSLYLEADELLKTRPRKARLADCKASPENSLRPAIPNRLLLERLFNYHYISNSTFSYLESLRHISS